MRISIRTKKRRLLVLTGEDVDAPDDVNYVQLASADLTPAPDFVPEGYYLPDEEEERGKRSFGFKVK